MKFVFDIRIQALHTYHTNFLQTYDLNSGISPMLSYVPDFSGLDGTNIPDVSFRPHLLYNPFIPVSVRMDVLDKNRAANRVLCGHVAF